MKFMRQLNMCVYNQLINSNRLQLNIKLFLLPKVWNWANLLKYPVDIFTTKLFLDITTWVQ